MFRFLAVLCLTAGLWASDPELLYNPTCPDIQMIGLPQEGGGYGMSETPALAWNGREYASAWGADDNTLCFRRYFADGTPAGPIVKPLPGFYYVLSSSKSPIVWNGTGYGVAFIASDGHTFQVWFARLDEAGALLPAGSGEPPNPQRVSFVGVSPTVIHIFDMDLAWSGAGYAVTWPDLRNGVDSDIFCTLLNADGRIGGAGESNHDIPICTAAEGQSGPVIAYSSIGGNYLIVWTDMRNGSNSQIVGRSITQAGSLPGETWCVAGTANVWAPALVAAGNRMGLAWLQNKDGVNQVFFTLMYLSGGSIMTPVQVSWCAFQCWYPTLAWTGVEYGLFYSDNDGTGHFLTKYQRISSFAVPVGGQSVISPFTDFFGHRAAFGRYGYLHSAVFAGHYLTPLGCRADTTPPTCPANLLAYNITGDAATVSWLPSTEDFTDIAYYQVYRDNIPLARTANNYWRDTGLDLSTTYNYSVRPVNAAQMENGACSESIYLKTNATLILKLDKSTPDAHLYWTDGGMNNYNVFRGTSPQVMKKIGNTWGLEAEDAGVLADGVTYFYTVDDPGQ